MAVNRKLTAIAGVFCALTTAAAIAPASAQGIFESLLGGLARAVRHPPADVGRAIGNILNDIEPGAPRNEGGPRLAYCVRTCDGHYFPVHAHAGFTAAQMCKSFCPASETKLYSGGSIDYAAAPDGGRYADLPQAFAYRQKLVANCTCNGKSAFGLANIDAASDPTLQRGDILATKDGLVAVSERGTGGAQFTPIASYRGLPDGERKRLTELRVSPSASPARTQAETTGAASRGAAEEDRGSWFSFTLGCGNLNGCGDRFGKSTR